MFIKVSLIFFKNQCYFQVCWAFYP